MAQEKKILVVAAHTADWLWRSGGTIAKYAASGADIHIVCLTFGARGESGELWKTPGQTTENVKKLRYEETMTAASIVGVKKVEIWDFDDCVLEVNQEITKKLAGKIREVRPNFIITHDKGDNTNPDHGIASEIVFLASVMSIQSGIDINGLLPAPQMAIYGVEPSQTEGSGFMPQVYIDITETWEKKIEAMDCIVSQKNTPEIHRRISTHRGWQARRLSGNTDIKFAEAFSMRYPVVASEFPCR
jgi:4-oxalomesaconate hydratase